MLDQTTFHRIRLPCCVGLLLFASFACADESWVGKKVVAKTCGLDVRSNGIITGKLTQLVYVVKKREKDSVWLRDIDGTEGWVAEDNVVPLESANEYFVQRISKHPTDPDAHHGRGGVSAVNGDYSLSITNFNEAIRLNPGSAPFYNSRGNTYFDKGDYYEAIRDFDHAIRLDPKFAIAFLFRGDVYLQKMNRNAAIANYSQAIRISPAFALAYERRAHATTEGGFANFRDEVNKAVADLSQAISIDPSSADAYHARGVQYSRHHNQPFDEKAIADFSQALRINPQYALALSNRAIVYRRAKRVDLAIADLTEAIRLNPKNDEAYKRRAIGYEDNKEFDKAIADFSEAIRINPKAAEYFRRRGDAYSGKKEIDKAEADKLTAKRLEALANIEVDIYRSGKDYLAKNEFDDAVTEFSRVLRARPNDKEAYDCRGKAYRAKEEFDRAISDFDDAIRLDFSYADAYYDRALAFASKKEYGKAVLDYNRVTRLSPKFEYAYIKRGIAYHEMNVFDKAIADFGEAIKIDPASVTARYERGLSHSASKAYGKAVADYIEAIRIDPKYEWAYHGCAWLWATCPDASMRDGKKAVEYAKVACEMTAWKNPRMIATLGAAYAEAGDFEQATNWQRKALESSEYKKEFAEESSQRVQLYEQRKPFRQLAPSDESKPAEKLLVGDLLLLEQSLKTFRRVDEIELPNRVYLQISLRHGKMLHFLSSPNGKPEHTQSILLEGSVLRGDRIGGSRSRYYKLSDNIPMWKRVVDPAEFREIYLTEVDDDGGSRWELSPNDETALRKKLGEAKELFLDKITQVRTQVLPELKAAEETAKSQGNAEQALAIEHRREEFLLNGTVPEMSDKAGLQVQILLALAELEKAFDEFREQEEKQHLHARALVAERAYYRVLAGAEKKPE